MGRFSQLGGAMLGTAVALNAGEALSQGPNHIKKPAEPLGVSGQFKDLAGETCERIKGAISVNDSNGTLGEMLTPSRVRETVLEQGRTVEDMGGSIYRTYEPFACVGTDPLTGGFIFKGYSYRVEDPDTHVVSFEHVDQGRCRLAEGWVHQFEGPLPYAADGSRSVYLVLSPSVLKNPTIDCPKPKDVTNSTDSAYQPALARIEVNLSPKAKETPKVEAPLEYVPHSGKFADLEPSLVRNGIFLVPILTLDASAGVPLELTTSAYTALSTHAGLKRTVYREYVLEDYNPETGTLKVRDIEDASECMETQTFKDQIISNKTSYLLSEPGSLEMKDVVCKEEAASTPLVAATPVPAVVEASPKESKPWKVPVRAGLSLGADVEETSEYSLGTDPALHASAQVQPFAIPLEVGVSGDFIFTGEGSGLEGLDLMVGGQPVKNVPVRAYLTFGDSFEARDRYSETTLNGALSYGLLVEGDIYKFTLGDQALALGCNASAQKHLYGGGGQFNLNVAGGCGVVWGYVVSGGGKEKKERPMVSEAAVSAVAVEAQPKGPHLEMETKPYSYEIPVLKETKDEEKKGKRTQLSEEMVKRAQRNEWDGVEHNYDDLTKLKIPLSYKTHILGAEAARAAGNIGESYERLLIARTLATTEAEKKAVEDWIADYEGHYAGVEIVVDVEGTVTFLPSYPPFAPDIRLAIPFVQEELAKDGSFDGFIPISEGDTPINYTLNGQTIQGLPPVSSKVTTEIRLEK